MALSVDGPVRLHRFSKSPDTKLNDLKVSSYELTKRLRKIKEKNRKNFEKNSITNFITKKNSNRTEALLNSYKFEENKHKRQDFIKIANSKYQPRVKNLPPIKNQLAKSLAYNGLISSVEIKFDPNERPNSDWYDSESEEEGKYLQEYLKKYNLNR